MKHCRSILTVLLEYYYYSFYFYDTILLQYRAGSLSFISNNPTLQHKMSLSIHSPLPVVAPCYTPKLSIPPLIGALCSFKTFLTNTYEHVLSMFPQLAPYCARVIVYGLNGGIDTERYSSSVCANVQRSCVCVASVLYTYVRAYVCI